MNLTPAIVAVYGSVRTGRARMQGDYRINWNSSVRILPLPHLASTFVLEGGDTRVTGQARAGLTGLSVTDVKGRAGPGLAQLVPGAWQCDMTARVTAVTFAWLWRSAGASGKVDTPAGTCSKNASEVKIPPLTLNLRNDDADALISLLLNNQRLLAEVRISRERVLDIRIEPAAADVFPQLPRSGPINLQLPF